MTEPMRQHGEFSWNELMTSDVEGAKAFYGKLLGWEMEEFEMNMPYTVVKAGDEGTGGIMKIPAEAEGMPPQWGAYVTVTDVDDLSRRVEEIGGKLVVPLTDIPEVGRFCVIQDPQGATLGLITYAEKSD